MREHLVICLGKYEAILQYHIFTKKIWTHKDDCRIVPKYEGYGIMILDFQSQEFVFLYPLTVPDIQTINAYRAIHPKYVDTNAATTTQKHAYNEPIATERNNF